MLRERVKCLPELATFHTSAMRDSTIPPTTDGLKHFFPSTAGLYSYPIACWQASSRGRARAGAGIGRGVPPDPVDTSTPPTLFRSMRDVTPSVLHLLRRDGQSRPTT
jgi:hypothetical protein